MSNIRQYSRGEIGLLGVYIILVLLASCYAFVSLLLSIGRLRLKRRTARSLMSEQNEAFTDLPFVSILVPARNEEKTIANCLESLVRQRYPSDRYEIVVVNDRSTDRTATIIREYQEKYKAVKCVDIHSNSSGLTGKQNALSEGLKLCTGEIILNTDADCMAGPLWVRRTVSHFTPQIGFTIGFSTTYDANGSVSFFSDLQSLDMLFLMDIAAGAIGMNFPVSCLGRNLGYRKAILDQTDYSRMGYTITEDAALIRAVAKNTNWDITVVYDKDASVLTFGEKSAKQFLSQRIRWIMGGQASKSWLQIPLHISFLFHLCLVISFPLMFFVQPLMIITLLSILVKAMLDFVRCWRVCREFEMTRLLKLFVPYEVFMVWYTILAGFGSMFIRRVRWKGDLCTRSTRHAQRAQ